MNDENMNTQYKRMSFKGNKVWAAVDASGDLAVENGSVLIKYNLKQDYEYRVKEENLEPEDAAIAAGKKASPTRSKKKPTAPKTCDSPKTRGPQDSALLDNCIRIYTDGASSGNPGPAGIGVLLLYGENRKEISRFIGEATNNIAELTAIKVALEELKRNDLPVRIFSDSSYSIGLLTKSWKPKKNQELVEDIRSSIKRFKDLSFIKVKGHSGIKENEIADYLATSAIKKRPAQ
ncbi:MAG: ribonuclease HI [Proteobacteria bacterium]|nr:ribonuclease HI [Pseudomonadota bacterium]MBU1389170.1 ribonuclease HI [Pseudomonadota bacterium]MBU1543394.1 ribonuclease HI [Pseudomonadota bacterium]MBU2430206.1 ribonuclease HI [Pseudomonadota bacterium]MBU2482911.1 ribonuclease HI [Pseudomonadota bacterium]